MKCPMVYYALNPKFASCAKMCIVARCACAKAYHAPKRIVHSGK
jgi:hypothetical protein